MPITKAENQLSKAARALFGAVIIAPENADAVRQLIPTNIFYRPQDRIVYEAILNIEWPDIIQVGRYIKEAKGYPNYYNIPANYLSTCIKECPICFEYQEYAEACIYFAGLLAELEPPKNKKQGIFRESA